MSYELFPDKQLFQSFLREMNSVLRQNESDSSKRQSELFGQLFALEREFRDTLLATAYGRELYFKFMHFITQEMGNILYARPYFRERQDTFSRRMSKAFKAFKDDKDDQSRAAKDEKSQMIYKFRINFLFADWILKQWNPEIDKKPFGQKQHAKLLDLIEQIKHKRRLLCENSLPLALCRAKIFWGKTSNASRSHLQYVDLIQNSAEGLMIAIDKFAPPYKTVFRSTAIGRMTESMMTDFNATTVKLPPKDRRILYRYYLAKKKLNTDDKDKLLAFIQESFPGVTWEAVLYILNAAVRPQSIDFKSENGLSLSEKLSGEGNPEESLTGKEEYGKLMKGVSGLPIIERKIVVLKTGL